jgi:hypothetical protein
MVVAEQGKIPSIVARRYPMDTSMPNPTKTYAPRKQWRLLQEPLALYVAITREGIRLSVAAP